MNHHALDALFRERIGFHQGAPLAFEELPALLAKAARAIPFENLAVMAHRTVPISKETLIDKIIDRHEGGLCYELNALLYLFLLENGFDVSMIRGLAWDSIGQRWNVAGRTHVTNIVTHQGARFVVDTGFGGSLPLVPVPLSGQVVVSSNGAFRIDRADSEPGDYLLYRQLKYRDQDWQVGYAFRCDEVLRDLSELNEIQKIIVEHPASPFNKRPLVVALTDGGSVVLTDSSLTEWIHGQVSKKEIDHEVFKELAAERFGLRSF